VILHQGFSLRIVGFDALWFGAQAHPTLFLIEGNHPPSPEIMFLGRARNSTALCGGHIGYTARAPQLLITIRCALKTNDVRMNDSVFAV
jgi:hypothetical protein